MIGAGRPINLCGCKEDWSIKNITIRETAKNELSQILAIYPAAFPDEELRPVVSSLIKGTAEVLSLAAFHEGALIGHVVFTVFNGDDAGDKGAGALLGPLGVLPELQGQGIGSGLVQRGLERLDSQGTRQVFVLGDPKYYSRFGFRPERLMLPPYPLPQKWADAWQSLLLSNAAPLAAGHCLLPEEWMKRALWMP